MYPKKLPKHSVETFRLELNAPNNERLSKAYYHTNDYPINMHSHNFYEINIVVEGVGAHYIENISIPIGPGSVFAIPPKSRHGYWAEDDRLKIFHLILPEYIFEKYEHELAQFPGFAFLFEIEPLLRHNSRENFSLTLSEEELARLRPELDNLIYTTAQKERREIVELFDLQSILLVCTLSHLINREYMITPPPFRRSSRNLIRCPSSRPSNTCINITPRNFPLTNSRRWQTCLARPTCGISAAFAGNRLRNI